VINLRKSLEKDISSFIEMENSDGAAQYITPYSVQQHQQEMRQSDVIYLSILSNETLAGFIILATNADLVSVEFRRIVVASKGNGIGQLAIEAMEVYCTDVLFCNRIWLDVFESNKRGQHIYQKLGYRKFKSEPYGDNILLYMEKRF